MRARAPPKARELTLARHYIILKFCLHNFSNVNKRIPRYARSPLPSPPRLKSIVYCSPLFLLSHSLPRLQCRFLSLPFPSLCSQARRELHEIIHAPSLSRSPSLFPPCAYATGFYREPSTNWLFGAFYYIV